MRDTKVLALARPDLLPRQLDNPVRGVDRMMLAVLLDRYGDEAMARALDDIRASKAARSGV